MTATLAHAQAVVHDDTEELIGAITSEFLALLDWSWDSRIATFPQAHPQLGWTRCRVDGCDGTSIYEHEVCSACVGRWKKAGRTVSLEEFAGTATAVPRSALVLDCSVTDCQRPWRSAPKALCAAHHNQRTTTLRLSLAEFLAHSEVVGLPSFGHCHVAACDRDRVGTRSPYCEGHQIRLRRRRNEQPALDEELWRQVEAPLAAQNRVSLRGLPDRVVAEILYGLQQRTAHEVKTHYYKVKPFADLVRRAQVATLDDLPAQSLHKNHNLLRTSITTFVRRRTLSPETERHNDTWDCLAFGHRGWLRFGEISQHWLREATKHWAFNDLPRRRGRTAADTVQARIKAVAQLSASLRLQRPDHGEHPALLGRSDITALLNRLGYLEGHGRISRAQRIEVCGNLRRVLARMRSLGLTGPGGPLHGMADAFALGPDDIPDRPEESEAGRDLPVEVMRVLCAHLELLQQMANREIRLAVELMIDTGRRPDEVCNLAWDCLSRDSEGRPELLYDNGKSFRLGRRLPISAQTAALIIEQQQLSRARHPHVPVDQLKLIPTTYRNPNGTRGPSDAHLSNRHKAWVEALPEILVPTVIERDGRSVTIMRPFDKARIFPYAYRHTYAQRHADAGVAVDVLKELMDHRQLDTTQKYYNVGQERRRAAVDRVTTMQFDRDGNRIWRQANALLASEHTRRAIGEVAVPYGICTEPSNVAAGGHDCPVRFRCVGCGHFRTDVSYLPDLEAYLADLLRNRERLAAAVDADDWAKAEALPSNEEITRIRALISRVKAGLDDLDDAERRQILDAVAVVRRARNGVVGLGLPRVRQPLPDLRPDRNA